MSKKLYFIIISFVMIATVDARENPFVPILAVKDGASTIKKNTLEQFDEDKVSPPKHARILKDITVEYQNLDGSITQQKLKIDKRVDWKAPIDISQVGRKKQPYKKEVIAATKFLSTIVEPNKVFIETDDEYIRDFIIIKPFRIVVDFKRSVSFESKVYKPKVEPFTSIAVGNHRNYYRVVITIDSRYAYDVGVYDNGVLVQLK